MKSKYRTYTRIWLAGIGGFLLFGSILFAALNQTEIITASEECIRCHVSIYTQGTKNRYLHMPFWERQCVVCHLAEGASWSEEISISSRGAITGTVVSQEGLWRKQKTYSGATVPVFDQLINIPALKMNTAYRFRIVVSPLEVKAGSESYKGLWLGLRPREIDDLSSALQLDVKAGLSTSLTNVIKVASLYRNGNTVLISWETIQPYFGWVELQEMEGLNLADLAPDSGTLHNLPKNQNQHQHPPLRDPEDLAINTCYQCHPESTLGTSHPIRLYGGQDVRIPDDLPTVDGMLTCVTCHNPHGAPGKMLVRETIVTKLCVACHYKYKNSSPSTMFQ